MIYDDLPPPRLTALCAYLDYHEPRAGSTICEALGTWGGEAPPLLHYLLITLLEYTHYGDVETVSTSP